MNFLVQDVTANKKFLSSKIYNNIGPIDVI